MRMAHGLGASRSATRRTWPSVPQLTTGVENPLAISRCVCALGGARADRAPGDEVRRCTAAMIGSRNSRAARQAELVDVEQQAPREAQARR